LQLTKLVPAQLKGEINHNNESLAVSKIQAAEELSSEDEMASGIMTPPKVGDSIIKNEKSIHTELE